MIPFNDVVNGMFESIGGIVIWHSVHRLLQSKRVMGISWLVQGFFALWGWWNLWYYPSLNQWCSFAGGVLLVIGNTVWVILAIHYHRVNLHIQGGASKEASCGASNPEETVKGDSLREGSGNRTEA